MVHMSGGKSKVVYASTSGFHAVDLDTGVVQNIYIPAIAVSIGSVTLIIVAFFSPVGLFYLMLSSHYHPNLQNFFFVTIVRKWKEKE